MNLSTLLNDENQDANKPPRRPSGALPRQNTLPTLRTDSYRSPGGPPSRQSSFESQNPALLHSPAIQRLTRPEVAYHSQYSPGGSAQYGPINTPLSPYAISTISPGNQHQYGNRPSSHASVPSTPSSTYGQTPHTYHESPVSNYPYPNAGGSYMQHPLSQPGTPLGPPNGPFRLPSHGSRDSPSILNTLQSPSGGTHGHPVAPYRPSPQASISHIVNAPLSYDQAPAPVPLIQTNTSETDDRERSVSVSPKTVLNVLPSRLNSTSSLGQSHADISSPTRDGREARSQPAPPAPAQLNNQDQHHTTLSQGYPVSVVPRTGGYFCFLVVTFVPRRMVFSYNVILSPMTSHTLFHNIRDNYTAIHRSLACVESIHAIAIVVLITCSSSPISFHLPRLQTAKANEQ